MASSKVGVVAGPELADYHFGDQHPFGPQRHQAFLDGMQAQGLTDQVDWLQPVSCHLQSLLSFHTADYIDRVRHLSELGEGYLDYGDTPARKGIYQAACTVVGSVVDMLDRIMHGEYRRGFVPIAGLHHSYRDHCSGFCVFNDCAIAFKRLAEKHQFERVLYVDIDAHHGDGVYYSFESDSRLYLVDFHEDGRFLYPGSGAENEVGKDAAKGCKMNIPMPVAANDDDFARHWSRAESFIRSIQPQFIILQCGADSMQGDPITHLQYSAQSFQLAATNLCRIADECCQGRILGLGGGGYNLQNIALAWPEVVKAFVNTQPEHL